MLKNSQKIILALLALTLLVIALMMVFDSQNEKSSAVDGIEINPAGNERDLKANMPRDLPGTAGFSKKEFEKHREQMEKKMDEDLEKYFSLKTQEEKNRYLDELISEHKKRMDERVSAGNDDKNPPDQAGGRGRPSPQEMKKHLESTSPEKRARKIQMMTEMRARENSAR